MTVLAEPPQDLPAMPPPAKSNVNINTVGLDIKPVDALLEEYWSVICLSGCNHKASLAFMMFSNSVLKSSSVLSVWLRFFGDQISIVSSMPMNWMS